MQVNREEWAAAQAALQRGIDKGQLKDLGSAQLMMGIALYNQEKFAEATPWFQRARAVEKHRNNAGAYLQLIQSKT